MTINAALLSAALDHEVDLLRYSNAAVRRIIGVLNQVDADLVAQLAAALAVIEPEDATENFGVQQLEQQLSAVRALNTAAYMRLEQDTANEMHALTSYEGGYHFGLFDSILPEQVSAQVGIVPINTELVYAAAMSRPFQGRLLNEWTASLDAGRMRRIRDTIRLGFIERQTVDQIVRRIRGTRSEAYSDGIMNIDRREAETIVRTALAHTAAYARDQFYTGNAELVKQVKWVAVLDPSTSHYCFQRDGKLYDAETHNPIGHKLPWGGGPGRIHHNCRSVSVPITKSWRELGAGYEFDAGTRASMDGQVPADMDYATWLRQQSAERQDQVLGVTRAKLFRSGALPLSKFSNERGKWLTLDELRQRNAAAFKKVGI
jgi:hypothetical protein